MAVVNAAAITFLPPDWADNYIAATLPKTDAATTENRLYIDVPGLHIDAPIVEGIDPDSLLKGVGHDPASVGPGEQGRFILSGHRFWPDLSPWATVFFSLDKLKVGDTVNVSYGGELYSYKIYESFNVPKDKAHPELAPATDPILTIYTCGPTAYSAKNRLGFHARLDETKKKRESIQVMDTLQDGILTP